VEVPVYNLAGEVVENITISDDVFAVPFNEAVVFRGWCQAFPAEAYRFC